MRACTRLCRDCGLYIHRKVTFFIYFASISFALNVGQIKLTFFYFQEGGTSYHIVQLQVSNHPDKFQEEILYWSISIPKQILWSIHLGSSGAARWPVKVATKLRFVSLLLTLKTHTSRCLIPFSYFYCSKVVPPPPTNSPPPRQRSPAHRHLQDEVTFRGFPEADYWATVDPFSTLLWYVLYCLSLSLSFNMSNFVSIFLSRL